MKLYIPQPYEYPDGDFKFNTWDEFGPFYEYIGKDYDVRMIRCANGYDVELYDKEHRLVCMDCTKIDPRSKFTDAEIKQVCRLKYTPMIYKFVTEH